MNLLEILKSDNYLKRKLSPDQEYQLDKNGFILIEPNNEIWNWIGGNCKDLISVIDQLKIKEGFNAGSEGKEKILEKTKKTIEPGAYRLGNLLNKSLFMKKIATLPEIIWASYHIIKSEIKLSSVLYREPKLNSGDQQIHIDWIPRENDSESYKSVVAFLYLNDSNSENGATIVVPGTHKLLSYPDKYINPKKKYIKETVIDAKAGSLLIMNSLVWHKGGNNLSGKKRGIIVTEYRERSLKQLLNLKKYISKQMQMKFDEIEKYLFGLRDNDSNQKEDSFGPGEHYRDWLKQNDISG